MGSDWYPAARGEINGMRVLLAEDALIVGLGLQSILETMGAAVAGPAATVAEAARLSELGSFDAAVVDMNLQGEMAYGLIDRLNERGIPVVVVTGYELPSLTDKVVTVLQKPLRAEALLKTLRHLAPVH